MKWDSIHDQEWITICKSQVPPPGIEPSFPRTLHRMQSPTTAQYTTEFHLSLSEEKEEEENTRKKMCIHYLNLLHSEILSVCKAGVAKGFRRRTWPTQPSIRVINWNQTIKVRIGNSTFCKLDAIGTQAQWKQETCYIEYEDERRKEHETNRSPSK